MKKQIRVADILNMQKGDVFCLYDVPFEYYSHSDTSVIARNPSGSLYELCIVKLDGAYITVED